MRRRALLGGLLGLTLLLASCQGGWIGGAPTRAPLAQVPTRSEAALALAPAELADPSGPAELVAPAAAASAAETPAAPPAAAETPAAPSEQVQGPPPEAPTGSPVQAAAPTPLSAAVQQASAFPAPEEPGMRAGEAALLFSAPIPAAADIMEWRPPAVPVPHALHPNDHYWLRRPLPSGTVDWGLDWYPYGGNGWGTWRVHHGMDFPNDPGTPVLAAGDGVVVWVKENWVPVYVEVAPAEEQEAAGEAGGDQARSSDQEESGDQDQESATYGTGGAQEEGEDEEAGRPTRQLVGPYGNYVIIRHDWGWNGQPVYTVYAHLLEVLVQVGDRVRAGELIAGVGNTGASSGPHLHFEVRIGSNDYSHTYNPGLWIAPYEGWGTLAGRVTTAQGSFLYNAVLTITPVEEPRRVDPELSEKRTFSTYASDTVNPDPLWGENFVIPDLPAGDYRLEVRAGGETLESVVSIRPGVTTLVRLHTRAASE